MSKTRRILSLILAVAVLASCFVITASADTTTTAVKGAFTDVPGDATYATSVKTLNLMGIINGYPDGTFLPLNNVTRAEFTAMLMRTLGYANVGSVTAADLPFSDVKDDDSSINWAIPNINTAYGMGIINGYEDGTFRPNANVAYEEAIKMIVCALGRDVGSAEGVWYSNYLAEASKVGITKRLGALGAPETPASRACIAQMIFDSLEVNIVEREELTNKTILTDYLGYIKNTGMVASDGVTGMSTPDVDLRDNEIQIYAQEPTTGDYEVHTYRTSDTDLKKYLGYQIDFYYKNDGSSIRNLVLYVLTENEEVVIDPALVEEADSTSTRISYYKTETDRRTSTVSLDAENVVIYNGKLYGEDEDASRFDTDMIPEVGTITLLDSNEDGKYELVNIMDYELYYVSSKVTVEYSITDNKTRKDSTNNKLILDVENGEYETKIVNTNGTEIAFSSINTGDVICLARSNPGNGGEVIQTAVVVTDTVKGTVTSKENGESVEINETTYRFSNAAPWMTGADISDQVEPENQDTGVFCLDINGDIFAYEKEATNESISYGYIMGSAKSDDNFDDTITLRILTQSGSEIFAELAKNTKIYGKVADDWADEEKEINSVQDILAVLKESAQELNQDEDAENVDIHQVIKYTTRQSGGSTVLSKIVTMTPTSNTQDTNVDKLNFYNKVSASTGDEMKYVSASKMLSNNNASVNVSTSIIFSVPSNRRDYDDYSKKSLSSALKNGNQYNVEVYDVTGANNAKVIVLFGESAATPVDYYSPIYVVNDAYEETKYDDKDGNKQLTKVEGYFASYSTSKGDLDAWISDSDYSEADKSDLFQPKIGDIFRAGTDRYGNATAPEKFLVFRPGADSEFGVTTSNKNNVERADFTLVLGTVMAKDDTSFTVLPERVDQGDVDNPDEGVMIYNFSSFSGARTLKYDEKLDEFPYVDASADYEGVLKGLATYKQGAEKPSKVLIYSAGGTIRLFCVLPESE